MTRPIRKVAVLGAGTMGSGIAAHIANAGLPVRLLDIVPPKLSEAEKSNRRARNAFADGAMKKMAKTKPAPLHAPAYASLITTGNFDDDLDSIADCDLIIEAVLERIDIKRPLFEKIEKIIGDGDAIVSSNTSGLRIEEMLEGRTANFKKNFVVTHFFNPPRYMKLLELVPGPDTSNDVMARVTAFGENMLGKGIVVAKDTPNFVANRIGTHNMLATVHQMLADGLAPEDVDGICGVPMGHPKSAVFRTADLVGLDVLAHVSKNCYDSLVDDEERDTFKVPAYVAKMVENKILGDKTRGGFYKKTKAGIEVFDPQKGEYRPKAGDDGIRSVTKALSKIENARERVRKLVADDGKAGQFAWKILSVSLGYAARRMGEICDDVTAIDNGMKWGYNWELGPFETWDALGFAETYDRLVKDGIALPDSVKKMRESGAAGFYREDGAIYDLAKGDYVGREADPRLATLDVLRQGDKAVISNAGGEAWDLGDGVLGVTFKTKANSIDADSIQCLMDAVDKAEREFQAVVIANRGDHFCVGANLFAIVMAAGQKDWEGIRGAVGGMQNAMQRIKYAQVPVVAAPYGMSVGGGCEITMAATGVQAAAETYIGLVEVGVGLLPGGAGNMNLLWRALEAIPDGTETNVFSSVAQTFRLIAMANVATSAGMAKLQGYLRPQDGISFDKARLLTEAKARAIGMAQSGYRPPLKRAFRLPGESGIATLKMLVDSLVAGGQATEHDALIAGKVATVLCGGAGGASHAVTEEEMLELEREAFVSLCGEPKSQERMQHMLMKNKPLRN